MYVGVAFLPSFTLDGHTFDGVTIYREENEGDEFGFLPKLDKQNMFRFAAGFRARPMALEISYERTRHDGAFLDAELDASFNAVNVDAKFFFNTRSRIQPHVVAGLAFPWLTVHDGAIQGDVVGDARYRGQGLNLEGGVTVFATPRVGVSGGFAYRVLWFNRVRAVSDEPFRLDPRFRESSGTVILMGFVTL
jgi:hypothetical protein